MRRAFIATLACVLLISLMPAAAPAQDEPAVFFARLDGAQETPPVTTAGTGVATARQTPDGLLVQVVTHDLEAQIASHIHCGEVGLAGPVGVTLTIDGNDKGRLLSLMVTAPNDGNDCGWASLDDVVQAMIDGVAYVDVHTYAYWDGEIRGQLAAMEIEPGRFTDTSGNIHEANIDLIAAAEITLGCNPPANDEFCPADDVSRGQMAAFLTRALNLQALADGPFTDIDGSVFREDINTIAAAGITEGCTPTEFCPDDPVRRDQMASFINEALFLHTPEDHPFLDISGNVHSLAIIDLYDEGITEGCTEVLYCPADNVRRDQMASFLARAIWGVTTKPFFPAG
ncbi:MAG TPA: CHRD domain-containing protein [Acidimicrobiia bacterium]|jgi:hypothetical protein|nr:CHRD domain-containing protein [Acidimicrobiia bacterium]